MAGKSVSNINIGVVANTAGFSAVMKRAGADVSTFVNKTARIGSSLKGINTSFITSAASAAKWGSALTTAAVVGAAYMYKQTTDLVSAQVDLASSMNISVAALAGLDRAADLSGSSVEGMHKAIEQMNKRIGEASMNTAKAADIQAKYGVSVRDLLAMPTEQRFLSIAETMRGMSNEAQKAAFANAMFGKSGIDLINTLNMGAGGLQAIIDETKLYGIALSDIDAARVEESGDALANVGMVAQGVQMQLTAQLAPAVIDIANRFTDWAISGGGVGEKVGGAIDYVIGRVGALGDTLQSTAEGFWEFSISVNNALGSVAGGIDGLIGDAKIFFAEMDTMSGRGAGEGMISNALDFWAPEAGEKAAGVGVSDTEKFFRDNAATAETQARASRAEPRVSESVNKWWDDVNAAQPGMEPASKTIATPDTSFADEAIANLAKQEIIKPQKLVDLDALDKGVSRVEDIADIQSDITDEIEAQNQESGTFKNAKLSTVGTGGGSVSSPSKGVALPAMNGITTMPIDHFAAKATGGMTAAGQVPTTGQRGASGSDGGMLAVLQSILEASRETAANTRSQQVAVLG